MVAVPRAARLVGLVKLDRGDDVLANFVELLVCLLELSDADVLETELVLGGLEVLLAGRQFDLQSLRLRLVVP